MKDGPVNAIFIPHRYKLSPKTLPHRVLTQKSGIKCGVPSDIRIISIFADHFLKVFDGPI